MDYSYTVTTFSWLYQVIIKLYPGLFKMTHLCLAHGDRGHPGASPRHHADPPRLRIQRLAGRPGGAGGAAEVPWDDGNDRNHGDLHSDYRCF